MVGRKHVQLVGAEIHIQIDRRPSVETEYPVKLNGHDLHLHRGAAHVTDNIFVNQGLRVCCFSGYVIHGDTALAYREFHIRGGGLSDNRK